MPITRLIQTVAVTIACVTWILPTHQMAWAAAQRSGPESRNVRPLIRDVALSSKGRLAGKVIGSDGARLARRNVVIRQDGQPVVQLVTDDSGRFALEGLSGGLYQVETEGVANVYRFWASDTAPPGSENQVVLIAPEGDPAAGVARSQSAGELIRPRVVIAGMMVAAAIAIPIAVNNSRNDPPPGS